MWCHGHRAVTSGQLHLVVRPDWPVATRWLSALELWCRVLERDMRCFVLACFQLTRRSARTEGSCLGTETRQ
jgi:hypothetical protein